MEKDHDVGVVVSPNKFGFDSKFKDIVKKINPIQAPNGFGFLILWMELKILSKGQAIMLCI